MEVTCLEDKASYRLMDEMIAGMAAKLSIKEAKWITPRYFMSFLSITAVCTEYIESKLLSLPQRKKSTENSHDNRAEQL